MHLCTTVPGRFPRSSIVTGRPVANVILGGQGSIKCEELLLLT